MKSNEFVIDIFQESMNEYIAKLNDASLGNYELDNYDMQVLSIAMDQFEKSN